MINFEKEKKRRRIPTLERKGRFRKALRKAIRRHNDINAAAMYLV